MDDKTLELSLLFDFFGDLLTEKQREYFDLYYNDDLSLSEIAELAGISRQGVHDNIVRAEAILRDTEAKTGIVSRFSQMYRETERAEGLAREILEKSDDPEVRRLTLELTALLGDLKG